MGKRKKAAKAPTGPKKRTPLATTFQCLFCNHENSVTVKMEKKAGVGNLSCKICGQSYQAPINYLSAAVDVYADWLDACEDAQKTAATTGTAPQAIEPHPAYRNSAPSSRRKGREVEDDGGPDGEGEDTGGLGYEQDGFVVEDDDAAEADYGDDDD